MVDQARSSVEVGLKTTERQAEEQRQKLHSIEIDLATQKQMVIDLQVELQKAKEEVQLAREAAEAEKKVSYQLGAEETEIRLAEELLEVCQDYCDMTWDKALTVAGIPADSALRLPGSIYYHPQICEIPSASSPPAPALAPESYEQPLAIPNALPLPKISKGSSQVGDRDQEAKGEKGKDKDKGKKSSAKAKDAAKVKEAEAGTQETNPKAKDAPSSQPNQKEDPPVKAQPLGFTLLFFFFFVVI